MPKTAIQAVTDDLGNGQGYIYALKNNVLQNVFSNDENGGDEARLDAIKNIPFASNTRAFGTITINTAPSGTVVLSSVNIPGSVNQLASAITLTGLTAIAAAEAIRDGLNNYQIAAAADYTATTTGAKITVYAPASIGSQANAHTISLGFSSGALDTDIVNPSGGSDAGADTSNRTYKLDANYDSENSSGAGAASDSAVGANAVDITSVIVPKSASSGAQVENVTIASGKITFTRKSNITLVELNTEGAAATDDLTDIETAGFSKFDILILVTKDATKVPTVKSTGNITLAGVPTDFALDNIAKSLFLRYDIVNNKFVEFERNNPLAITVANMRAASIPKPVSGTETITFAVGGGTENRTPGTDKGYLVCLGTGTLTGSWTIQGDGTPLNGETWLIDYRATFTPNGNNFTIFGYALTATQITNGNVLIIATYDSTLAAYRTRVLIDLGTAGAIESAMVKLNNLATNRLVLQAGLTAGSYTNVSATVDAQGVVTAMSSGSALSAGMGAFTENMALVYGAANDLRLTAANGTVFSATNVGKVVVPSTSGARTKVLLDVNTNTHYFIDDVGASDIIGEEFGVTSGIAWGNARPFYLYACNLNDTAAGLKFAISPNSTATVVPAAANIGYHGNPATTPSDKNFFFLSETTPATLAAKPCALIGRIRMTMSAADDWTVVTDASGTEAGIHDNPFFGYWYTMPVNQMGAAASTFFKTNGGTAPVFTTNQYRYKLGADGYVDAEIYLNADGGTDGAGAVDAILALPYLYSNADFDSVVGMGTTVNATPTRQGILCVATLNSTICKLHDNITHVAILNSFYINGARTVLLKLRYQAFLL